MIDRQRAIRRGEVEATEEDIRWMQHELIEIALTQDGMTVEDAHVATLAIQGVQNWDIWPTSVYWTYRESLGNSNWDRAVNARP